MNFEFSMHQISKIRNVKRRKPGRLSWRRCFSPHHPFLLTHHKNAQKNFTLLYTQRVGGFGSSDQAVFLSDEVAVKMRQKEWEVGDINYRWCGCPNEIRGAITHFENLQFTVVVKTSSLRSWSKLAVYGRGQNLQFTVVAKTSSLRSWSKLAVYGRDQN